MMAPDGSNGDVVPASTTKPMFLLVLFQVTVVPAFTQKNALPFGVWMLAVEDAPLAVRFMSTSQGVEADPHVLLALQSCAGLASEQAYLLAFCAVALLTSKTSGNATKVHLMAKHRSIVITHLTMCHSRRPQLGAVDARLVELTRAASKVLARTN